MIKWHDLTKNNGFHLPFFSRKILEITDESCLEKRLIRNYQDRLILGNGSNLVIMKPYFDGLVIILKNKKIKVEKSGKNFLITASAGIDWHWFVMEMVSKGYYGLENLTLIPGTVGAAPVQNIGAYGVELSDFIHCINAFDLTSGKKIILRPRDLKFRYRSSMLKLEPNRFLVLSVVFKLFSRPSLRIDYEGIREVLEYEKLDYKNPNHIVSAIIKLRKAKLPDPATWFNVGSFFINPIVSKNQAEQIIKSYPDCPKFHLEFNKCKIFAGWLIEKVGLKGKFVGDFGLHKNHALVIVNRGAGKSSDLCILINIVRRKVFESFGIQLEIEPTIIK